jgi:hypothetical protein
MEMEKRSNALEIFLLGLVFWAEMDDHIDYTRGNSGIVLKG